MQQSLFMLRLFIINTALFIFTHHCPTTLHHRLLTRCYSNEPSQMP